MQFSSINIQGNIISTEILTKIREEDIKHQTPASFGLDNKTSLRDEIGIAWSAARAYYTAFKLRVERLKEGDSGASETRNSWIIPLLRELGYDLEKANAYTLPESGKKYPISHKSNNRGDFAVHIMGVNDSLDKRRDNGGPRLSPHALVQEFLNNTEHDYALVTNGKQLRLLRDATRLVRLSYLEVNIEKMMEEELYADFAVMFRLLHATRMPTKPDEITESIIEYYHQESLSSGSRIRNKLSEAVEESIKTLANGFLQHPDNADLRNIVLSGTLTSEDFYLHQLRVIYRLLFLIVTEERNLVYPDTKDADIQRLRKIYYDFYSIERLRKLALKSIFIDGNKKDLWQGLKTTFMLYENGRFGESLGIKPLGSGLFSTNALGDLPNFSLSNAVLLRVIRYLTLFENDNRQLVRVNYSDLDVEEFGSVYEGLLEYDAKFIEIDGVPKFTFVEGKSRSSSGSHYTPEELVKPLIKHSLDYLIEERLKTPEKFNLSAISDKKQSIEIALLSLKVCDVACGSGHILLSAARRIAMELARVRTNEDQPSPSAIRHALRDVIKNCIYGVDKNPLAVELCKVALWLEAHNPGEPLNFLDHHIKCGDAIVGLAQLSDLKRGIATEAFKALPEDNKAIATLFRNRNKYEKADVTQLSLNFETALGNDMKNIMQVFDAFNVLPERTPNEILAKQQAYNRLLKSDSLQRLKTLADLQIMPFFVPKTPQNQDYLLTDANYRRFLRGEAKPSNLQETKAITTAETQGFFHWFLEFPAVFQQGGFDCILGNPPFLGDKKLSGSFGDAYLEFLKYNYSPIGAVDLVTYFFRRIYTIIQQNGFQSLISTNTIAQGDARKDGLHYLMETQNATINHAVKSMKWPGLAAVEVALVTVHKGTWNNEYILDNKKVSHISSYLDSTKTIGEPFYLEQNRGKSFIGSYVLGSGFILEPQQANALIKKDPSNKIVLFPYLNGDDLNNNLNQNPSRWIINFFDWALRRYTKEEWNSLDKKAQEKIRKNFEEGKFEAFAPPDYENYVATDFPDCFEIVERLVKPERQRWAIDKDGNEIIGEYAVRKPMPERWWIYGEKRPGLYKAIQGMEKVIALALTSKTVAFDLLPSNIIFSHATGVISLENYKSLAIIQSTLHNQWVLKYASSMKSDLRYTPSDCFETFPFPQNLSEIQEEKLEQIGETYHEHRRQLMLTMQLGLTKNYNLFHSQTLALQSANDETLDDKAFEKKMGKDALYLRKHLAKTPNTCTFNAAVEGIFKLRTLHVAMDNAVLEAYGWAFDSAQAPAINLRHDFYEVDYLPENDRIRYTIHPEARKEVLKRLLQLNHKIHAEEMEAAALQGKLSKKAKGNIQLDVSNIEIGSIVAEPKSEYQQLNNLSEITLPLFSQVSDIITEKSRVTLVFEGKTLRVIPVKGAKKGDSSGSFQHISLDSPLAQILIGKKQGEKVEFEGKTYKIQMVG